jgi:hypothetical protein
MSGRLPGGSGACQLVNERNFPDERDPFQERQKLFQALWRGLPNTSLIAVLGKDTDGPAVVGGGTSTCSCPLLLPPLRN